MEILTEAMARNWLKDANMADTKGISVKRGTIITPSAKSFLAENKIDIEFESAGQPVGQTERNPGETEGFAPICPEVAESAASAPSNLPAFEKHVFEGVAGGFFETKPEHMTHLYGAKLVNKDHPVIAFRGAVDHLEAKILETQVLAFKNGRQVLVDELQETLDYAKNILRAEVLKEALPEIRLIGLNSAEIREHSHYPKTFYGINHFAPTYRHGEIVARLNALRTVARSVELVAYQAFKDENGLPLRQDIAEALNRLSSVYYIMMFKALNNSYES